VSQVTFAIGEVAAMLGLSTHTIRAWERRHVLDQPMRAASGQRRYTAEDVERLRRTKHERRARGQTARTAQALPEAAPGGEPPDPLRMVPDLVPEVVVVIDATGQIRHGNMAFLRFANLMPGQLAGMQFADLVDPFDRAKAVLLYQQPGTARRGWELGLRTARRRALFSFDCWPVPAADGPALALVGRQLGPPAASAPRPPLAPEPPASGAAPVGPAPAGAAGDPQTCGVPEPVRALLGEAADAAHALDLLGPWLDATSFGVVLAAGPELTVVAANAAFRGLVAPALHPVEGRPWARLAPDGDRLAAAAREVIASGRSRTVPGLRPDQTGAWSPPAAVWDVDLCPAGGAGGPATHLLIAVRDATAEVAAGQRLDALTRASAELRAAADRRHVLSVAARYARALIANAGSLVAERGLERRGIAVVGGDGVWTHVGRPANRELRLALIRDVMRNGVTVEVERDGSGEAIETLRIVPLPAGPSGPVRGALAFSRLDGGPFSAAERLLVAEFAGRVCGALARVEGGREAALSA
jgi:hypothetical protein